MRHQIQTHPAFDFVVGHNEQGEPAIFGLRYPYLVSVRFDRAGVFTELRLRPLGFQASHAHSSGPPITEEPRFVERVRERLSQWQMELRVVEGPIRIEEFEIRELSIGIDDLPRHLKQFLDEPSTFSAEERGNYPEIVKDWRRDGNFVLRWGGDYYLNAEGEVI